MFRLLMTCMYVQFSSVGSSSFQNNLAQSLVVWGNLTDTAMGEPKNIRIEPLAVAFEGDKFLLDVLLFTTRRVAIRDRTQAAAFTRAENINRPLKIAQQVKQKHAELGTRLCR